MDTKGWWSLMSAEAEQLLNPFPWYKTMRENSPVYQSEPGVWHVFRYDDVKRVLSDFTEFSSGFHGGAPDPSHPIGSSLIAMDPPRHNQLRSLVSQAFTPRAVDSLGGRIQEIAAGLLGNAPVSGSWDLVETLGYPLPVIVIAELLGIPAADRDRFKQWSDAVVTGTRHRGQAGANPQQEMAQYLAKIIEMRRVKPEEDLISRLLGASVDGQSLSTEEILGFAVLLLVAGNETTTNLIGNTLLCLNEVPEQQEYLRFHPEAWPGAIEESLRFRSPVQSMFRVAVKDAEVRGQVIRAGERVVAWIGSANRDEEQFPHAGTFDIARSPNKHIAFGFGVHFCLGAPLARLEAQSVLPMLVNPTRSIRVQSTASLEPLSSSVVYGVKHIDVALESF